MATRRELFAGEVLYRQGDPSDCAWLVESGAIELTSMQGRRTVGHMLGPGELIGELGMLDGAPDDDDELVDLERLLQVVQRAELHGLDRALDRRVGGHHQDLRAF